MPRAKEPDVEQKTFWTIQPSLGVHAGFALVFLMHFAASPSLERAIVDVLAYLIGWAAFMFVAWLLW